jgi:Zn-dependent protease with chaperone function
MRTPEIAGFAAGALLTLAVTMAAVELLEPLVLLPLTAWPLFFFLDAEATRRAYARSSALFERGERNRFLVALSQRLGIAKAFLAFAAVVEVPAFALISFVAAPVVGSLLLGEASFLPCMGAGAAVLAFAHAWGWYLSSGTCKTSEMPGQGPPAKGRGKPGGKAVAKLLKDLEREALGLGMKLKPEVAEGEVPVRPPLLPGISSRFGGAVRIPKALFEILSESELRCVWFHEVAHVRFKHLLKDLALGVVLVLACFPLAGGNAILFVPLVLAAGFLVLAFHRRFEFEADMFAAKMVSSAAMVSLLKKMERRYGEERGPLGISHPSARKRIQRLSGSGAAVPA